MKYSFYSFAFVLLISCVRPLAARTNSQPEVLLVGIAHEIESSLACNWQPAYEKILKYKPDGIAVEYVMPSDTASLPFFLGEEYRKTWDGAMIAMEGRMINAQDSVDHYFQLSKKVKDDSLQYKLWKYYYLNMDLANRDYLLYQFYKNHIPAAQIPDTTSISGKRFWRQYKSVVAARKDGEFFNLVFPLAKALNLKYIYPTDDQSTYSIQSEAWGKFYERFEGKDIMHQIDSSWKLYTKAEKDALANCNLLGFQNSPETISLTDKLQTKLAKHLNDEYFEAYVAVWYKRNKSIANNIHNAVKKSGARRMVVFYGNMHVYPVKKYLEEQGYKVKILGEIK
jgi:hypothetical protein